MIEISCPNNFLAERTYVLHHILQKRLGINIRIVAMENSEIYIFRNTENKKQFIFPDLFWNWVNNTGGSTYLSGKYLPHKISLIQAPTFSYPFPVIEFSEMHKVENLEYTPHKMNWDWVALVFFMLTRWEEYVNNISDEHRRFDGTMSIAHKSDILHLPVVDFATENVRQILQHNLGVEINISHKFQIIPTHDIDNLYRWSGLAEWVKEIAGDMLVRKSFKLASETIRAGWQASITGLDPYFTLSHFMAESEKNGLQSVFNFMVENHTPFDQADYLAYLGRLIKMVKSKGHEVGMHFSYSAGQDKNVFLEEFKKMKHYEIANLSCRSHFLRARVPDFFTWCHEAEISWDSSLYYSRLGGFRCGTCHPFPVFDFIQGAELQVIERPLIFMDTTWVEHKQLSPDEVLHEAKRLKQMVKELNGEFVFLWHNTSWNSDKYKPFRNVYHYLISAHEV